MNTNLEQISDWLTKIIVGISLVQIGKLPSALGALRREFAPLLGASDASGGVGVVIAIAAAIAAFLLAYLYTRVTLESLFSASRHDIEEYSKRASQEKSIAASQAAYKDEIEKAMRERNVDPPRIKEILDSADDKLKSSAITIDFRPFDPALRPIDVPVFGGTSVDQLLNFIFGALPDSVPPRTYGDVWLLHRPEDGKDFRDMGNKWAKENGSGPVDRRRLEQVGIRPGQSFEVIRPGPSSSSRPQP